MLSRDLTDIRNYLHENLGLDYTKNREQELYNKLSNAAGSFGHTTSDGFLDWLLKQKLDEKQAEKLASFLTIGETYFFREEKALNFLEFHYLPQLLAERRGNRQTLKIWSAGCSSGEEPYTIAILLNRLIKDIENWKITILASDINPDFIKKAKSGIYTKWSFRNTSDEFQKKYFDKTGSNQFQIKDWIKKQVTFTFLNLASDDYPSVTNGWCNFDVILCRNVLIYFSQEGIKNVASKFYKSLVNKGVLLVSPVEASSILNTGFSHFMFQGTSIFQKTSDSKNVFVVPETKKKATFIPPAQPVFVSKKLKPVQKPDRQAGEISIFQVQKKTENPQHKIEKTKAVDSDIEKNEGNKVRTAANKGELDLAKNLCLELIQKNKLNEEAYYLLASIYAELGDTTQAISTLERTLFLNPDFIMAHFLLGEILVNTNYNAALRHFKNALKCISKLNANHVIEGSDGLTAKDLEGLIHSII